jgi:hypothetical protein
MKITEREFMINALGASEETMMKVLTRICDMAGTPFTEEEALAMRDLLAQPDARLEVATMLLGGAAKAGIFE